MKWTEPPEILDVMNALTNQASILASIEMLESQIRKVELQIKDVENEVKLKVPRNVAAREEASKELRHEVENIHHDIAQLRGDLAHATAKVKFHNLWLDMFRSYQYTTGKQ